MWGQGLWEPKHQEGREEEQGTAEQEAAPPGSNPARVIWSDVQVTCQQKGHPFSGEAGRVSCGDSAWREMSLAWSSRAVEMGEGVEL